MVHERLHSDSPAEENEIERTPSENKSRTRQKVVSILFFAFFILLWLLLYFVNRTMAWPQRVEAGHPRYVVVEVPPGSPVAEIAERLSTHQLISSELIFTMAAAVRGTTHRLKSGEYRFDRTMSLLEILTWLEQGRVMLHKFTVPEGSTVEQIAMLLSNKRLADPQEVLSLANDAAFCQELGLDSPSLEGFLFPETYKIAKGLSAESVLRIMVDRFWHVWIAETNKRPDADELNLRDIVSIASIIEKEAIYDDEELLIASVIYNRLKKKMPLQCDVTIRYPLDNYGVNLTYADLELDSPYNSYRNRGLPPTPICNPGRSAIRAALSPPKTDYLYFVSMNNKRHKFSTNLKDHNDAVRKYQVLNEVGESES
ncbi:MAG: endolytic transglycosylase MltG [Candidatus Abyssobacteria bacterium SURF_5]|uniref:Endolytic murein transglycosylase n=1 Tax=Abyssobacteria bacterium (strain SURF_5) TaxID=2093360 RepID=A0A3A4NTK2_ABYX5|nr:MAG: endolytic transglycosylase MltG [Candidatus Abyssubacteria bacterium SURF_5]